MGPDFDFCFALRAVANGHTLIKRFRISADYAVLINMVLPKSRPSPTLHHNLPRYHAATTLLLRPGSTEGIWTNGKTKERTKEICTIKPRKDAF